MTGLLLGLQHFHPPRPVLFVSFLIAAFAAAAPKEMFGTRITLLWCPRNRLLSFTWFFLILHQPTENCDRKVLILS
jgi:hypothetical protein